MKRVFAMTLCALVGCGLMAGLFFVFSVSVMRALAQLPPEQGMAAMQAINVSIVNPVFLVVFLGTPVACAWVLVSAVIQRHAPGAWYLIGGSVCYLVGALLVTALVNVPMNNALAAANPTNPDSARLWATYLTNWTIWNHVRTVASLVATILLSLAFSRSAQI